MSLELRTFPDPILLQDCDPVTDFTIWEELSSQMVEAMIRHDGCGLAAPQVGLPYRAFVMLVTKPMVVINPEVLEYGQRVDEHVEGCLSLPGGKFKVGRPRRVKAKWQALSGKWVTATFDGLTSRVFQHEYDHTRGRLINRWAQK